MIPHRFIQDIPTAPRLYIGIDSNLDKELIRGIITWISVSAFIRLIRFHWCDDLFGQKLVYFFPANIFAGRITVQKDVAAKFAF